MKTKKHLTKNVGAIKACVIGILFSLFLYTLLSLLFALVAYLSDDPTARLGIYSLLSLSITGLLSGALIARKRRRGRALLSLVSSLFISLLIIATGFIGKGSSLGVGTLINCLIYTALSLLGAIALAGGDGKSKRHTRVRS